MLSNAKKALAMAMVACSLLTSGCWDRKEIENRGFVTGVAIDYVPQKSKDELKKANQPLEQRLYRITYELPKLSKKEEGKAGAEKSIFLVDEAESMFSAGRSIAAKTPAALFFEDIQIFVLSEEIARDGINGLLDFYLRDPEMRHRARVFIAQGRAEDILHVKMEMDETKSQYIAKITRNEAKSPYYATNFELRDVSTALRMGYGFAIPLIIAGDGELKITKAAIFERNGKMVGVFDEDEIMGRKILRDTLKEGVLVVRNPDNSQYASVFELYERNIKISAELQGNELRFVVKGLLTGTIGENMNDMQDTLKPDLVHAIEQAVADEYRYRVIACYQKQQQLKVDASELGDLVRRKHPQYWKQVKDRWDEEVFPTVPLDVDIQVLVRRPAMIR